MDEHRETLDAAAQYLGEDVFTEWEEQFIESCAERAERFDEWEPTEKQAAVLDRLREKLERKGLL